MADFLWIEEVRHISLEFQKYTYLENACFDCSWFNPLSAGIFTLDLLDLLEGRVLQKGVWVAKLHPWGLRL